MKLQDSHPEENPKLLVVLYQAMYDPWLTITAHGNLLTWCKPLIQDREKIKFKIVFAKVPATWLRRLDSLVWNLQFSSGFLRSKISFIVSAVIRFFIGLLSFEPETKVIDETKVEIQALDLMLRGSLKTHDVFKWSLTETYDFLVVVGVSSYINIESLKKQARLWPKHSFVAGRIIQSEKLSFPSGSFRVFSRDIVTKLVEANLRWKNFYLLEDVAVGKALRLMDIETANISWLDLHSRSDIEEMSKSDFDNTIQLRCKSFENGRRLDAELMKALHNKFM